MRSLFIALSLLLFAAPAAHAEVTDKLPIVDARDGVRLTKDHQLQFGPKAAKLYRSIRGRRALALCGAWTDGFQPDYITGVNVRLPRKRGVVRVITGGRPDVCALATRHRDINEGCPLLRAEDPDHCTKVLVAVTARGRAYLDQLARAYDLMNADFQLQAYPRDWATPLEWLDGSVRDTVALSTPDASPPAGKLGYWHKSETSYAIVTRLADGTRQFLRRDDGVISTNVERLLGQPLAVF
jgi:hypothetical protein